jgi:hypothetical protein
MYDRRRVALNVRMIIYFSMEKKTMLTVRDRFFRT